MAAKSANSNWPIDGTIFLDEIEDMSPKMQAHLLRFLEEGRVVQIGADRPDLIDVRVIAATNVDLEAHIQAGRFRADLYYRLNVLTLSLTAPWRARREDIAILVNHFLREQKWPGDVSQGAMGKLIAYAWPGSSRQLRNIMLEATNRLTAGIARGGSTSFHSRPVFGTACGLRTRSGRRGASGKASTPSGTGKGCYTPGSEIM